MTTIPATLEKFKNWLENEARSGFMSAEKLKFLDGLRKQMIEATNQLQDENQETRLQDMLHEIDTNKTNEQADKLKLLCHLLNPRFENLNQWLQMDIGYLKKQVELAQDVKPSFYPIFLNNLQENWQALQRDVLQDIEAVEFYASSLKKGNTRCTGISRTMYPHLNPIFNQVDQWHDTQNSPLANRPALNKQIREIYYQ